MTREADVPDIRGVGRDAFWNLGNVVVNAATGLISTGLALRVLGNQTFGLFVLINSFLMLASVFQGGLGASLQFSAVLALQGNSEHRRRVITGQTVYCYAGLLVVFVGGVLAFAIPWITDLKGDSLEVQIACLVIAASTLITWLTVSFSSVLAAGLRYRVLFQANLAGAAARLMVLVACISSMGVLSLALSTMAGSLAGSAIVYLAGRRAAPWLRLQIARVTADDLRALAGFTLPLFVISASSLLMTTSDVIVIGTISGAAAIAVFRVGVQVPQLAQSAAQTAYSSMYPRMAALDSAHSQESATRRVGGWLAFLSGAGFISLALSRDAVLRLLTGHDDDQSSIIFLIYCALFALDLCFFPWVTVIMARGQSNVVARLIPIELVLNLILTVLLVEQFGAKGAAFAAAGSLMVADLFLFPLLARGIFARGSFRVVGQSVSPLLVGAAIGAGTKATLNLLPLGGLLDVFLGFGLTVACGIILLGRAGRAHLRLAGSGAGDA